MEPRQLKELEMMARTEDSSPVAELSPAEGHVRRGNGTAAGPQSGTGAHHTVSGVSKPPSRIRPDPVRHDQMPGYDMMGVFHRHSHLLSFLVLLVFCSVMVVYQYRRNQSRHVEIREAFILLYTKGYRDKADRLYNHLVQDVTALSIRTLEDDWQRTVLLVDPTANQPDNLIWKYHWTVSNEMEKRSSSMLRRALQLAGEEK